MPMPEFSRGSDGKISRPDPNRTNVTSSSWAWLLVSGVLLLFANGANTIPLAAWLAPVFLLRLVRTQSYRVGLPIAYLLLTAGFAFQFRGMVPIPGIAYYIFLVIWGIPLVVPFLIDRLVTTRLDGLKATLVFPSAWAGAEYLLSNGPYATWGSIAYSQYGDLPLLQLVSVTGLWGITFLIGWFAAVCNWLWETGLAYTPARRAAWLCTGTIASVMLLGGARMALFPPSANTVRVASISKSEVAPSPRDEIVRRLFDGTATSPDLSEFRAWYSMNDDDLLLRAEREMKAGAAIVFWGEGNGFALKQDETAFVARGAELAAKYHAYLGMATGVWTVGKKPPMENKFVLIQPDGQIAWEYNKAHPVPGGEAANTLPGDGKMRILNTPYGRVTSIICFDADFPQLLAQAGAFGADVVLDPSNDWRAIDPWHTQMASFRGIEQGVNLIRQTSRGMSAAYDYQGRRLAAMDHFQTTDYAMISQIPTKGVRTIYTRLGNWFAMACFPGLMLLVILSLRGKRDQQARE
jgi:apolipoprotein N-acyltransferase